MRAYAKTNVGKVRTGNEDAYYTPLPGEHFAMVADGLGGHQAGEVASDIAVKTFIGYIRERQIDEEVLAEAVAIANKAIFDEAHNDPSKRGMGTTLTAVYIDDQYTRWVHVGDSRAYVLREGVLIQMTNDHSLMAEMLDQGEITPEQARTHPQRSYITRALGTNKSVKPDISRIDNIKDDVWLLCTDGLTNYMMSYELAMIMLQPNMDWNEKLDMMIGGALDRGGTDNITAVIVVVGEEDDIG